jgi:hypothetical protein
VKVVTQLVPQLHPDPQFEITDFQASLPRSSGKVPVMLFQDAAL